MVEISNCSFTPAEVPSDQPFTIEVSFALTNLDGVTCQVAGNVTAGGTEIATWGPLVVSDNQTRSVTVSIDIDSATDDPAFPTTGGVDLGADITDEMCGFL